MRVSYKCCIRGRNLDASDSEQAQWQPLHNTVIKLCIPLMSRNLDYVRAYCLLIKDTGAAS